MMQGIMKLKNCVHVLVLLLYIFENCIGYIHHVTETCCNPHSSSEISELLDGLQTHLLSKCCVHKI